MLSKREVDKIKKYIKNHNIDLINRNTVFMTEDINICPFLSEDNICNIYEVRPSICRSFDCEDSHNIMNYDQVKAINMLMTFSDNKAFSVKTPDLTLINERIKELQTKLNLKTW